MEKPRSIPLIATPPPDNPGVEGLGRISEAIKRMSSKEMLDLSVRAGIYTPDGQLRRKFGGTAD
jgi:hypothetical protein